MGSPSAGWVSLSRRKSTFDFDPLGRTEEFCLFPRNEDVNENGLLEAHEDLDGDGILDVANLLDPRACSQTTPPKCAENCSDDVCFQECLLEHDRCIADELLTFYERETNTLILRPVWPLEQRCTYGVILTDRLVGENGHPVRSPLIATSPRAAKTARTSSGIFAEIWHRQSQYCLRMDFYNRQYDRRPRIIKSRTLWTWRIQLPE